MSKINNLLSQIEKSQNEYSVIDNELNQEIVEGEALEVLSFGKLPMLIQKTFDEIPELIKKFDMFYKTINGYYLRIKPRTEIDFNILTSIKNRTGMSISVANKDNTSILVLK